MSFVWRDTPENPDLLWLAEGFAEFAAAGRWDEALGWAKSAWEVSQHGAYVLLDRQDGGCRAMTRQRQYCTNRPVPGEELCGLHARLIKRHHQLKETAPPDREEP
jgi:hypothetical protein